MESGVDYLEGSVSSWQSSGTGNCALWKNGGHVDRG